MLNNFFILIASDTEDQQGKRLTADEVIRQRIFNKQWEIYKRTKFKDLLKNGDICLFYAAGRKANSQHIIGEGIIKNIHSHSLKSTNYVNLENPQKYIEFDKVVTYEFPIDVKTKLDKLTFIPKNRQKWGMVFMNGCRKISSADYVSLTET
jgi:hypothetical protein